ncbi:unnamed protein product [Polarella glacialis]|uniref:Uncharacterized protein n=1 Tax=Polarella glacialis TaxID=89957 RepID=A0A813LTE7_POLGL|nr:unnamed protein product [Polarella glacialis]CAE8628310.1 unnamed protein product [Polarella glacialis]CAE8741108.1 unnamed protein product [Polarella glacialis]
MAAVKLIKFVAVAILVSSSAAEPTNRTCAGQDQDEMVALQVGEQSHAGGCHCGHVCPGYKTRHVSCTYAKKSYVASNPPGLDQEAFAQSKCRFPIPISTKCWSHTGSEVKVRVELKGGVDACPAGFKILGMWPLRVCGIEYATSMNVVCPHGWCECREGGCGCKARGSCR